MKVILTYIGLRINGEKVSQAFEDNTGKYHFWKGIKYLRIGHRYVSENNSMKFIPEDLGEAEVSQEKRDEWMAKEMAAVEFKRRKCASKKVSAMKFSRKEVGELHNIYKKLNWEEQHRFLEAVQRVIVFGSEK